MALLDIDSLTVYYRVESGEVRALEEVTLTLPRGSALGIVGESGCGKSSLAYAITRLLPSNSTIKSGTITFDGMNLLKMEEEEYRTKIRWKKISYIPQGSFNAFNPVIRVSHQIAEVLTSHKKTDEDAKMRAGELLNLVGIGKERVEAYPHELSGGMKQRAMISMALICNPEVLIADEPTTALDVIVQAKIMTLLKSLTEKLNLSLMLISHDISLSTSICDQIAVMYAGSIVENRSTEDFTVNPFHPYSRLLIDTILKMHMSKEKVTTIPGSPPDLKNPPEGCKFHPRCPWAKSKCRNTKPLLEKLDRGLVACHYPLD